MLDGRERTGLCLIAVAASIALTAASASGGVRTISSTLHVTADNTDVDHSDPGLAYGVLSWQIEYETCVPLLGYSDVGGAKVDSVISPIGAEGMPVVENGGRTYVFTVRSGFRFSDCAPLTAANYKYAIDRDASTTLLSPVNFLMAGAIKGWPEAGTPDGVSGVTASGDKLTIQLTKPEGSVLPKLAMPFFCPIEKAAPFFVGGQWVDSEVTAPYPSAGPYYLAARDVGTDVVLKQNPYYTGNRPHEASTILIDMNTSSPEAYDGVTSGTYAADLNGNPEPAQNLQLSKQFGIDKTRFWVHSALITTYLAMNEARPIFKSVGVRKGVNYALDRPAIIKIGGYLSGTPTVQVLPRPLTGGIFGAKLYPTRSPGPTQFAKARTLSHDCGVGHRYHRLNFWHGSSEVAIQTAAVITYDLRKMGCRDVNSVPTAGYDPRPIVPGASMDMTIAGWLDDYPDGYDFLHYLLDGRRITKKNDYEDLSFFNNKAFNQRLDQADTLTGAVRNRAFGHLDQWVMKNYAPLAPIDNSNVVDYLSPNAHGYVYDAPFGSIDLGDLYQS